MTPGVTPEDLRQLAAKCRDDSERAQQKGYMRAKIYEDVAQEMETEGKASLPFADLARILRERMHLARKVEAKLQRPGRPVESEHPFPRKLEERGDSVVKWAKRHKVGRKKAESWYAPKPNGRKIPLIFAKMLEKELGIPAEPAFWPNGIRE